MFLCGGALVLALAGVGPLTARAEQLSKLNILIITIDTLRADHISSYGYHLVTSPNLDRLAQKGIRFDQAYTTIPLTGPAHTSLFTGRYPQETGARVNGQPLARDPRLLTLPQILNKNGYATAAFVSAWPLKDRLARLDRGFEVYNQEFTRQFQWLNSYRSAEDVTLKTTRWLHSQKKSAKPFFLWVHYFDPHGPYDLWENFSDLPPNPSGTYKTKAIDRAMAERIRAYDSEIAYTDHHIGKLFQEISKLGLTDSTLILITADHGESLGERGYVGHGRQLYEYIVRVPMILYHPEITPVGQTVHHKVSLLDLAPTILDFTGIHHPFPLQGISLRAFFNGATPPPPRDTYFVTFPGKPWQIPKWISWMWHFPTRKKLPLKIGRLHSHQKLIWTPRSKQLEAYNLDQDTTETHPVFSGKVNKFYRKQVQGLMSWYKTTNRHRKNRTAMSKRDIEVLKTLGYID